MPDELTHLLDHIGLGTSLNILVLGFTSLSSLVYFIRKILDKSKKQGCKETLDDIEKQEKEKKLKEFDEKIKNMQNAVKSAQDKLELIKNECTKQKNEMTEEIKETGDTANNLHAKTVESLGRIETSLNEYDERFKDIEKNLIDVSKKIEILVSSDITTKKTYIVSEYTKCAIHDKVIDLMTLQQVEEAYSRYLEVEGNGGDDFTTHMVQVMRSLPVIEQKK